MGRASVHVPTQFKSSSPVSGLPGEGDFCCLLYVPVCSNHFFHARQSEIPPPRWGRLGGGDMTGNLTNIAKMLRLRSTEAEKVLWQKLRDRQLEGCKFRRQQPIGPYMVDFVNFEKGIIIELDGGQHATDIESDTEREAWLRGEGFQIIRFWNNDVFQNLEGVMETIRRKLNVPLR